MNAEHILLLLTPLFLLFVVVEFTLSKHRYNIKDTLSSAALGALHQLSDLLAVTLLLPLFAILNSLSPWQLSNSVGVIIAGFVIQDFLYYWFHRASHNTHWMWAAHVVHHSSPNMNFSTAFRQSFMYPIAGMWVFWTPMALMGFSPQTIFTIVAINLAFQFFVHTQCVGKLGPIEWLFNTPSHHRVHHSTQSEHIDKNYAGVLIIWDRLFGTFVEEDPKIPCTYGAREHTYHLNPLRATMEEWKTLWQRVTHTKGTTNKIQRVFSYPHAIDKSKE